MNNLSRQRRKRREGGGGLRQQLESPVQGGRRPAVEVVLPLPSLDGRERALEHRQFPPLVETEPPRSDVAKARPPRTQVCSRPRVWPACAICERESATPEVVSGKSSKSAGAKSPS